jgi:starch phosphorylase
MCRSSATIPLMAGEEKVLTQYVRRMTGRPLGAASAQDWLRATAMLVRDRLAERWGESANTPRPHGTKRVCYLSMEFLLGRLLVDALRNLGLYDACRAALEEAGLDLLELAELEVDPGLGNGGLGRLAACLLDSAATLGIPVYGYGIRYDYGMFTQRIEDGWQVERPDSWLRHGNPWEFARPELAYAVPFGGRVSEHPKGLGRIDHDWVDTENVLATAYDIAVPGYGTPRVNTLRLWSAHGIGEFDLHSFNNGDHDAAVERKNRAESLTRVLYPGDASLSGQELRFKQGYFFVSASIQDILRRFRRSHGSFDRLPEKLVIQINDTHPALGIAELMRLLVDQHHLEWERAWEITRRTFAYTNHTLMPEALETWPVRLFETLLPRHLQIIYRINDGFLRDVARHRPGDMDVIRRLSFIDEHGERRVRMAHLAFVGTHKVNGVSQVHTQLMKKTCFPDFDGLYPGKIANVTNGVSLRRWLDQANRPLAELVRARIGGQWMTRPEALEALVEHVDDAAFREAFRAVKRANKERLAGYLVRECGVAVDPSSLFDVQVKRIHEYKRQLLKLLHVIALYNRMRAGRADACVPRTVIFAGKAAPSYVMAKLVVKLIHDVAAVVNADPVTRTRLKVAFVPDYGVSKAERIIPAADLSEQISTAGFEASGTGNMKFALNGALTIGTLDGANIEIRDAVGADAFFAFGLTTEQVARLRADGYDPWAFYHGNAELRQALDMIASGYFSPDEPSRFRPIFETLTASGDRYFLLADFADYMACQQRMETLYRDAEGWTRRAIVNVARMGWFSSDRTARDYAQTVWCADPGSRTDDRPKEKPLKLATATG